MKGITEERRRAFFCRLGMHYWISDRYRVCKSCGAWER